MKRMLAVIMTVILLFSITGCGVSKDAPLSSEPRGETSSVAEEPTQEIVPLDDDSYENQEVLVDISVNGDGFYSTYANTKTTVKDGKITEIFIEDPVVLSFQVSSKYGGGVYILPLEDGDYMIDALSELSEQLKASGRNDLAEQIDYIYEMIIESGPYTYCPT